MAKVQRFRSIRQLHTIISQETIRPSSPTPPHLNTYNLSLLDQFAPNMRMRIVFFYPNYKSGDSNLLKQSLAKCLTQYYPLAGRFPTPPAPYINCNDGGAEFLEAISDSPLDEFIQKNEQDEALDQLFPYGLSCIAHNTRPGLVEVQLNHFACGGAAVAVSMSHKVADALTMATFINNWAITTRCQSPIAPYFISSSTSNKIMPEFMIKEIDKVKYSSRRFVFPNAKLNELKNTVMAMCTAPTNPTRVELLASLLFKHAVSAASTRSGSLEPSNLFLTVNMRNKFVENYPQTTAGNILGMVIVKMADSGEIRLNELIVELRKGKMELNDLRDVQEGGEKVADMFSTLQGDVSRAYNISSLCRFPFYNVDFGWGKPVEVIIRVPNVEANGLVLMDTPLGDGITAFVHLPEEEMTILQNDNEFVTYVEDI
ncbi:unnamed protein product [Lactuca saligna]|uniref:Transferase, Chloramphenicol acetyltransferase-like domain protein n=1 Tax=Lactuca saligna TaxID=75948 RepID=A0AA35UYQ7_LACSI|nr:unnamed protein product [Lactuca saligna]